MRFMLITLGLLFGSLAHGQSVELYQPTLQFNREINKAAAEQAHTHQEFMRLIESLEMRREDDLAYHALFEVISRGPAGIATEESAMIHDFRVILLPRSWIYSPNN